MGSQHFSPSQLLVREEHEDYVLAQVHAMSVHKGFWRCPTLLVLATPKTIMHRHGM